MALNEGVYFPSSGDSRIVLASTIFPVGAMTSYNGVTIEALVKNEASPGSNRWAVITGAGAIGMYQGALTNMLAAGYIGKSMIGVSSPNAQFDVSAKSPGSWNRLSGVISKGATYTTITLYWNGVLLGSNAAYVNNSAWYSNMAGGGVGGQPSAGLGGNFHGWIDDVRIWGRALSAAEVLANTNKELIGNESGLLHCWKFNEGIGTTSADAVATNPLTAYFSGTGTVWTNPYIPPFSTYVIAAV